MNGNGKIICKEDLNLIRILTFQCNTFNDMVFEAFLSPSMNLCGIHNFNKSVFPKGMFFFYLMTSI